MTTLADNLQGPARSQEAGSSPDLTKHSKNTAGAFPDAGQAAKGVSVLLAGRGEVSIPCSCAVTGWLGGGNHQAGLHGVPHSGDLHCFRGT